MNKWKCDICKKGFDNFHAQGFDNKIYCPFCFFKEENRRLQQKVNQLETSIATKDSELLQLKEELRQLKTNRDEVIEYAKGYFTKAIPFNPYVVIEKLERGKE